VGGAAGGAAEGGLLSTECASDGGWGGCKAPATVRLVCSGVEVPPRRAGDAAVAETGCHRRGAGVLVRRGGGSLDLKCPCFNVDHRPGDQVCPERRVPKEQKQMLTSVLAELLQVRCRAPHVATKCYWAVEQLSEECGNMMAPCFQSTVQTLLATTERADSDTLGLMARATDSLPLVSS
jgi:hypothetical protein